MSIREYQARRKALEAEHERFRVDYNARTIKPEHPGDGPGSGADTEAIEKHQEACRVYLEACRANAESYAAEGAEFSERLKQIEDECLGKSSDPNDSPTKLWAYVKLTCLPLAESSSQDPFKFLVAAYNLVKNMGRIDLVPAPPWPEMSRSEVIHALERFADILAEEEDAALAAEASSIDRMRQAISITKNGNDAQASTLITAAKIRKADGLRALRILRDSGEYTGTF